MTVAGSNITAALCRPRFTAPLCVFKEPSVGHKLWNIRVAAAV